MFFCDDQTVVDQRRLNKMNHPTDGLETKGEEQSRIPPAEKSHGRVWPSSGEQRRRYSHRTEQQVIGDEAPGMIDITMTSAPHQNQRCYGCDVAEETQILQLVNGRAWAVGAHSRDPASRSHRRSLFARRGKLVRTVP